ncbi:MAG: formate dehydrogenase accessory protein FdhE [Candidatus Korarchaeota archaeon]|nr:formate dehydrogenase accessory protein FdhE [Candidatus Korarchaeota archaeon]
MSAEDFEKELRQAVDLMSLERPESRPSLLFLLDLIVAQSSLEERFREALSDYHQGLRDAAKRVTEERKPLLELISLPDVPEDLMLESIGSVLRVTKSHREDLAENLERMEAALFGREGDRSMDPKALVSPILSGRAEELEKLAGELGVDRSLIEAIALWSVQPLLKAVSKVALEAIDLRGWYEGRCPVCGSHTRVGFLRGEGKKLHLHCRVCGAEWPFQRIKCPFCGNEDQDRLGFYTVGGDNRFRLYFCDECGRYWKVVDEEVVGRKIPRVLYDAWTSHLDLAASERGLK